MPLLGQPKKVKQAHTHTTLTDTTSNTAKTCVLCVLVSKFDVFSGTTCETSWSKYFNHNICMVLERRKSERVGSGKVLFFAYHVIRIFGLN